MNRSFRNIFLTAFAAAASVFWPSEAGARDESAADAYLIEAEAFQFKGKWFSERSADCSGTEMLRLGSGGSRDPKYDALTAVEIETAGEYNVWVRAADYESAPGTRLFRLSINEQPMEVAGRHGHPVWYWENVGKVALDRGPALLRLNDAKRNFGRCDAIFLTSELSADPNSMNMKEMSRWRKAPSVIETEGASLSSVSAPMSLGYGEKVLAALENPDLRLSFVMAGAGGNAIACRTEINVGGVWRRYYSNIEDHKVMLLTSEDSPIDNDKFYPSWKKAVAERTFTFNGRQYTVQSDEDFMNPFVSGNLSEAIPVSVLQKNDGIEVIYITKNGSVLRGLWTLPGKGTHINLELTCQAAADGMYSMCVAAFQPVPESSVENVLMPPMFQFKRFPVSQTMLLSSMMQQPLAVVESSTGIGGPMSAFVSGDDTVFPEEWGSVDYSPMGFTLRNYSNEFQPVAFAPVMGMPDSGMKAGETLKRKFVIGIRAGKWNDALLYVSDHVYKVCDYRKQEGVSLTDAMFNIWDLMKNTEYGGWDESLKGFYDIEGDPGTAPTVVHSAPLAIVAASVLSDDEDFYLTRALPTIEYTLSRSGYRWAVDLVPTSYNKTLETLKLNPFRSQFTTAYYEGLDRLLGDLNPWLEEIALPDGDIRQTKGYSAPFVSYVEQLSAYRMTGDEKWLQRALSTADRYMGIHIYNPPAAASGQMAFYNANIYAPWWNLLDLYEITGESKYMDAAKYGAASTIAGVRSFPAVHDSLQTIHPGGHFEGNTTMWWKGREKFRLGFPRQAGDAPEKQVPQWLVSPVGLGFEQPGTYFLRQEGKQVRPVFMSNWAPHLLRLYQYTGDEIYQTYARNAVIGRFRNYPGYYATGYTDITVSADFPYRGPDVSSIYYHHIPPHLAFTQDYLITECIQRSGGNVTFPYSIQEGFVWFTNRIYGGGAGRIFSDRNARLLMRRGLVSVDNPEVNYVTAVSDKNFWILLSNESSADADVSVRLEDAAAMLAGDNAVLWSSDRKSAKTKVSESAVNAEVPAKGFRAIALPLPKTKAVSGAAPLKDGMRIMDGGETFGKIFLFRIRSPFGWDSVYGFAETHLRKDRNLSVRVECNGISDTADAYPFEWSFDRFPYDEDIALKIILSEEGKADIVLDAEL